MESRSTHPEVRASDGTVAQFPGPDLVAERAQLYEEWCDRAGQERPIGHELVATISDPLHWADLRKPLSDCTVALVSTGGIHLRDQPPFDVYAEQGDWSSRLIGGEADTDDLTVTHTHYATQDALRDINVMFPLDRLRELVAEGFVGAVASSHYGLMGFVPDPKPLVEATAPELARDLQRWEVDVVVLTGG